MFTVYIVTIVMFFVCLWIIGGEKSQGSLTYNIIVFFCPVHHVLFANFAEAIAEAGAKHSQQSSQDP